MGDIFQLLKKNNPNLDITFDPITNTVKVNNSEELEKKKEPEKKNFKRKNSTRFAKKRL